MQQYKREQRPGDRFYCANLMYEKYGQHFETGHPGKRLFYRGQMTKEFRAFADVRAAEEIVEHMDREYVNLEEFAGRSIYGEHELQAVVEKFVEFVHASGSANTFDQIVEKCEKLGYDFDINERTARITTTTSDYGFRYCYTFCKYPGRIDVGVEIETVWVPDVLAELDLEVDFDDEAAVTALLLKNKESPSELICSLLDEKHYWERQLESFSELCFPDNDELEKDANKLIFEHSKR